MAHSLFQPFDLSYVFQKTYFLFLLIRIWFVSFCRCMSMHLNCLWVFFILFITSQIIDNYLLFINMKIFVPLQIIWTSFRTRIYFQVQSINHYCKLKDNLKQQNSKVNLVAPISFTWCDIKKRELEFIIKLAF